MKVILSVILYFYVCPSVSALCRVRDDCVEVGGNLMPCYYNGSALPIYDGLDSDEIISVKNTLEQRCPHLLYDDEGNRKPDNDVLTCCTPKQISEIGESLALADAVLGRCPSCIQNFMRQICEMNCSPEQDRFLDVFTDFGGTDNNIEYVYEMNYRLYTEYMDGTYNSCKDVLVPQTGLPAINLMCGNAPVCDAEAWFAFTGDNVGNPFVIVKVNFLRWPTAEDSMDVRTVPCNETVDGSFACSCVDCFDVCPVGSEPSEPQVCTVLSVHCAGLATGLVVFVLSVAIFSFLSYKEKSKPKTNETERKYKPKSFNTFFELIFANIGAFAADNAVLVIMLTTWLGFAMIYGALNINLTTNPLELWSDEGSRSRQDLNYFNSRFGPFYRASQVFLKINKEPFVVNNVTYGPAYTFEAVQELVALEDAIINIGRNDGGVTLEDVCYAPTRSPGEPKHIDQCVSMSVGTYLGSNRYDINSETYLNLILNCLNNHYGLDCTAPWGGGAEPGLSLGGYDGDDIFAADSLLINFPINNYLYPEELVPVLEWELKFLDLMKNYEENLKPDFIEVAYGAERSIEDEIERVSRAEILPIAISYILMFVYVVLALGNIRNFKRWFLDSKIMVALSSMLVVILSIICAMGVMGYINITSTLLAVNVIPFFVLSVGIDNVFLMVNTLHDVQSNVKSYDGYKDNFSFEQKRMFVFSKMLSKAGPSMFVSSVTQITCFSIGALSNFPAVKSFAIFAALSLVFLFLLQITAIVALLSLDYKRTSQSRFDVLFCIKKKFVDDEDPLNSETPYESATKKLMEPYTEILLKPKVKLCVVVIFFALLFASIIMIPQITIGLDQEMALPKDSYVYKYLQYVSDVMKFGPPVYFVLKGGLNFTDFNHQNAICGGQLCDADSLITQIFLASQYTNLTYIERSSNSWLDDFFDWTGLPGTCCKYNTTDGSFCDSIDISLECNFCTIPMNSNISNLRPTTEAFKKYLPFFLQDTPTETCSKGGLASYYSGVVYDLDSDGNAIISDSHFMSYHKALQSSYDFITATKKAYELSEQITASIQRNTNTDVEVFAYSVFYVYFEQYLTMWFDTFMSILYCLIGASLINLIASGFNWLTSFTVMFTALMVVLNMMGIMYLWSIPLNAVSCINLIVSIGISVEFCSHIAYAFSTSKKCKDDRIKEAMKAVGSTIITGITFTNIPVIALAFSHTEVIEVFFFRMFFSIVILGFLHGMVFYPVFLSYLSNMKSK